MPKAEDVARIKILGLNDFHGQISTGRTVGGRPVGGAAVVASHFRAAMRGAEDRTIVVHAGDLVGASPPASALLQDEPTISFFNTLGNSSCSYQDRLNPRCNLVGTLGNHEFDEGRAELFRLLKGGNHPKGPFLEDPWRGARYPTISANVVDAKTKAPIMEPFAIKRIAGIPIGFIGAMLRDTPAMVTPGYVAGLEFLDEADTVNRYVSLLRARGVRTNVLLIHQGGSQEPRSGPVTADSPHPVAGPIVDIVARLDPGIDVVISGHTHQFTNGLTKNRSGDDVLVAQAFSYSTAFDEVDLDVDRRSGEVVSKSASIITTWADEGPGVMPDARAESLVASAEAKVAARVGQVVGTASVPLHARLDTNGESALGVLIAEAQRAAMRADFGFTNPGGIRADLAAGTITWGSLFSVQPFGNSVVKLTLRGQQVYDVLNQQWQGGGQPHFLQLSGLEYMWSAGRPVSDRVVEIRKEGKAIDRAASYTVAVNSFLAAGGGKFTVFTKGSHREQGPSDVDALAEYIKGQKQPISDSHPQHIIAMP